MKKSNYLIALALGVSTITFAQNVGINTDGSDPDANTLLHLNNHSTSSLDSALLRIENEKATTGTGVQIENSGTASSKWDIIVPGSSTDLRIKGNGSDHVTIQNNGDVGIGTTAPTVTLDVDGDAIFNESGADKDFRIEGDTDTEIFMVDASADAVGISTTTPVSGLDVQTSMGLNVTTITRATTLDQTHNVILCNTGPYIVTLPEAASNTGKVYYIKNIDAEGDDITIDGNGSETIEGETGFLLDAQNQVIRIVSDGSNWYVIDQSTPTNSFISNCDGSGFSYNDVVSATGATWMDRNLGADQVSTLSNNGLGDYYQWGRPNDDHQCTTSSITASTSSGDVPGHGDFITTSGDWRTTPNNNLWQGVNGTNNPCPSGYRIPTQAEWDAEEALMTPQNTGGLIAYVLKLPCNGYRVNSTGSFGGGASCFYWSSTVSGSNAIALSANNNNIWTVAGTRGMGFNVRCIKD